MSLIPFAPFFTARTYLPGPNAQTLKFCHNNSRIERIRKAGNCLVSPPARGPKTAFAPNSRFRSKLSSVIAKKIFLNESGNI